MEVEYSVGDVFLNVYKRFFNHFIMFTFSVFLFYSIVFTSMDENIYHAQPLSATGSTLGNRPDRYSLSSEPYHHDVQFVIRSVILCNVCFHV